MGADEAGIIDEHDGQGGKRGVKPVGAGVCGQHLAAVFAEIRAEAVRVRAQTVNAAAEHEVAVGAALGDALQKRGRAAGLKLYPYSGALLELADDRLVHLTFVRSVYDEPLLLRRRKISVVLYILRGAAREQKHSQKQRRYKFFHLAPPPFFKQYQVIISVYIF